MGLLRMMSRLSFRFGQWRRGRQLKLLLQGSLALVAAAGVGTLGFIALLPHQDVEARYLERATAAMASKDYATAATCYERLAARTDERPDVLYGLALAEANAGHRPRAAALMAELAPAERTGYGPAHLWWAKQLLFQNRPTDEAFTMAGVHLHRALEIGVDDRADRDSVHALLCEVYLHEKQYDQAEQHLLYAVKSRPQLRMRAAHLYALRGDLERARREASMAVDFFHNRVKADLTDHVSRLAWADSLTFLDKFIEAVAVLEEGFALSKEPIYRAAQARVHLAWVNALDRDTTATPAAKLSVIEKGLSCDPNNAALLEKLLATASPKGQDGDKARAALQSLLANGQGSAAVHFALGVDALQRGETAQAQVHWEQANRLAPGMPIVANNLAWMIAHQPSPDLDRALSLVEMALKQNPDHANFRHTRGHILAGLKRWKDALPDLEAALPKYGNDAELHHTLAEVYAHLGVPAMEAEHKRLAVAKAARQPMP
jgi:tetratricopeptide (TPR) repeat protein